MRYYLRALGKYFSIAGRASRKEYWMFQLFDILFILVLLLIDYSQGTTFAIPNEPYDPLILGNKAVLYAAFTFIPTQTLQIRRLHDVNKSAFWWLVSFIPIINIYPYCLIFFAESNLCPNKYGDVPENVRGYQPPVQPPVYVNVTMNEPGAVRHEASHEKHIEHEPSTPEHSSPREPQRVHVKTRQANNQSQDINSEESTASDYESEEPHEEVENNEPSSEVSDATPKIYLAIGAVLIILLCICMAKYTDGKQELNVSTPKESINLLDSKNEEALIADFLSDKNAGYASDKFHADTPLIRISMSDKEATFGVTRVYDTSYHLKVSNDSIEAKWYDYYTRVSVTPKKKGISFIYFSNELNNETFQVMVVVS